MNIQQLILSNLINNEEYSRKVIAFLKPEYFHDTVDNVVFGLIDEYVQKYNTLPSKFALEIELNNKKGISELTTKQSLVLIHSLDPNMEHGNDWLVDKTEEFCKGKAIYNCITTAIDIIKDPSKQQSPGILPKLMSDALAVSFDTSIGTDFIED